ncbi:MAG: hypothetical protein UIB61_04140 [Treponema sp.]|nr:hypothetical protein [Treponema sp.]
MKKKMNVGFVVCVELFVMIVALAVSLLMTKGNLSLVLMFVDLPSLVLLLLFSVPPMVFSGMWGDFMRAFSAGKKDFGVALLKRSEKAVSMMQRFVLIGGFFSVFVALIVCLSDVSDFSVLGKNLAVVCISAFYTAVLEFLLIPLDANVKTALIDAMNLDEE